MDDNDETTRPLLAPVAAEGDRLSTLKVLRDRLALELDDTDSKRDIASLTSRFQAVLQEIADLEPKKGTGDSIDEIAKRRRARRASSASRAV